MKRYVILATLVWFSITAGASQTDDRLYFTHAAVDREQVNIFCPTPDGDVWLGTDNGLYLSKGGTAQLTKDERHPELSTSIRDLVMDGDGRLWVKTIANEHFVYDPGSGRLDKEVYPRICARGLTLPYEFHATTDAEGGLWLYGDEHCYRVDSDLNPLTDIQTKGDTIDRVLVGREHVFLYALHHLYVYSREGKRERTLTDEAKTSRWPLMAEDEAGGLWVADSLLVRWDTKSGRREVVAPKCMAQDILYSPTRKSVFVATTAQGLTAYDSRGRVQSHYSTNSLDTDPLLSNRVNAIAEDREGNLWLAYGKHGLSVSRPHQVNFSPRHIPQLAASGLRDDIQALCCTQEGALYLGTEEHGLFRTRPGSLETERLATDIPLGDGRSVCALHVDKRQHVWIGTNRGGLYEIATDGSPRLHLDGSTPISLASDKAGRMAACLLGQGFCLRDGEDAEWRTIDLGDAWCMAVASGVSGRFYVATTTGLRIVNYDGNYKTLANDSTPAHRLTSNRIRTVYADSRELVWFVAEAAINELQMYDPQADTVYHFPQLATTHVNSIVEDQAGNLWLGTNKGLAEMAVHKNAQTGRWDTSLYRVAELDENESPYFNLSAATIDNNGRLIFGTDDGFVVVHPGAVVTIPWDEDSTRGNGSWLWGIGLAALLGLTAIATTIIVRRRRRKVTPPADQKPAAPRQSLNVGEVEMDPEWDKDFVEQVTKVIEANISNPDFSVEELSQQMCMHRTSLYKRLVALTGMSPNQLIRQVRLEVACQYLTRSPLQVSEIAYRVGFGSPKIFTRHFKEAYGMSPSAYQQQAAHEKG